jgi:hypothetical protein
MLTLGGRAVTAALQARGLTMNRHFTTDYWVLNRASWAILSGSQILLQNVYGGFSVV